jgi:hypothetical protein
MKREKKKNDKTNFGVAFITIDSFHTALDIVNTLKEFKKDLKKENSDLYYRLEAYVNFNINIKCRIGLSKLLLVLLILFGKTSIKETL